MVNPNLNTKSQSEVGVKQEEEVPSDRIDIADDEDNNNRNDAAEIDEKVESDPQNTYLQVQSTLKLLCNFFSNSDFVGNEQMSKADTVNDINLSHH